MGTRSTVGVKIKGGFCGRYVHWDGYPTGVGVFVAWMINERGPKATAEAITSEIAWSSLGEHPDLVKYQRNGCFRAVPGIGVCHTEEMFDEPREELLRTEWNTWNGRKYDERLGGCEWAYGIDLITARVHTWAIPFLGKPKYLGFINTASNSGMHAQALRLEEKGNLL